MEGWVKETPFRSFGAFRDAFLLGLRRLLQGEGMGSFILVLANATLEAAIHRELAPALAGRFGAIAERCRDALRQGRVLQEPPDDLLVFLKLLAVGLESVPLNETREAGPWEIQFNPLRSFRPGRIASKPVAAIQEPFDPSGFHFNLPFLRNEVFWSGRLFGWDLDLLYNKFPFARFHALLVPNRDANEPQFLSRPYHLFAWELIERLGARLPGIGLGYNSYGAQASVNHLHFQLFLRDRPLPIALPRWRHQGGPEPYPANCEVYGCADEAWERLRDLHGGATSYNLVYLPGRLYCLPRLKQGSSQGASWCRGHAWYEMAGGVIAFNREEFDGLGAEAIATELAGISLARRAAAGSAPAGPL